MENKQSSLLKKAADQVAQVGDGASRLTTAASHAVEDTVTEVKRLAERSRYAAEELVDHTARRIKHDPLRSLGICFAVGLGMGMVSGWLIARSTKA